MADTNAEIKIEIKPPLKEVQEALDKRRLKLADMRTPYAKAAVFLDQWVQKNFKTEGGKVGGWRPFSPVTLENMAKNDPSRSPAKLLQKTGRGRSSFLPFANARNAGIGTSLGYMKAHHEGAGRLPERRLLPKRKEVISDVRAIMRGHIRESLKK